MAPKKKLNKSKYFIFQFLQSSQPLPRWQLCTLLAFSQPASSWMLFQQCWRSSHICWTLVGCFSFSLRSKSSQTISIGWLDSRTCVALIHFTYTLHFSVCQGWKGSYFMNQLGLYYFVIKSIWTHRLRYLINIIDWIFPQQRHIKRKHLMVNNLNALWLLRRILNFHTFSSILHSDFHSKIYWRVLGKLTELPF